MGKGRGRTVGGDCLETLTSETLDFRAELVEFQRTFIFIDRFPSLDHCLQPEKETLHGQPVLKVSLPKTGDLHFVLDRLPERDRRATGHNALLGSVLLQYSVKIIIQRRRINEHTPDVIPVDHSCKGHPDVGIVLDVDPVSCQLVKTVICLFVFLRDRSFPDKPLGGVSRDEKVGHHDRIVGHILPPHIKHPGDLIESGQENGIVAIVPQPLPQPDEFLATGPSDSFSPKGDDRALRDGRSVFPQWREQVRDIRDRRPFPPYHVHQLDNGSGAHPKSVNRHNHLAKTVKLPPDPFWDKHLVLDPCLVKLNPGPSQLPFRLDEITSVSPKTGMVFRYDEVTLPGVTGDPGDLKPS